MKVKASIKILSKDGYSSSYLFGELSKIYNDLRFIAVDDREFELRNAVISEITDNSIIVSGQMVGISGTISAYVDSIWEIEPISEPQVFGINV